MVCLKKKKKGKPACLQCRSIAFLFVAPKLTSYTVFFKLWVMTH